MFVVTRGSADFRATDMEHSVVRRTVGFNTDWEFVAEVTAEVASGGYVTVKEYGHTPGGALARAKAAATKRLTNRKYAAGFTGDGFRDTTRNKATFKMGFAT